MGSRTVELNGSRWLVLLLQGVERGELSADVTPTLHALVSSAPPTPMETSAGTPAVDQFFDALPLVDLRDRGLQLDRRSFCARPAWQNDRTAIDQLAHRPAGIPDAVVLWLRDAGLAAARCGQGTPGHEQALRDLDATALRATQRLTRDGVAPHVIALTLGPLHAVDRTFDPIAALRGVAPRKLLRRVRYRGSNSHLRLRCESMRDVARCAELLVEPPFTNHGTIVSPGELDAAAIPRRYDEVTFVPFDRVALGKEQVRAAARFLPEPDTVGCTASLPWASTVDDTVTIAEVATRFAEAVRQQLVPIPITEQPLAGTVADCPDLLSVMDEDVQRVLGLLS